MLVNWPTVEPEYNNEELSKKWEKIMSLKSDVAKELELARADKIIGHSLNAKVTLYVDEKEYEEMKKDQDLLLSVFIVSDLVIEKNNRKDDNKIGIKISQAEGQKCERCWMYSTTVGEDKENPTICHRCSEELKA